MPATFIPRPSTEIERKDPGFGGRPPLNKRPTGGGGEGDNNDDRIRRRPRELLDRYRLGLFFMLAGDLMFFTALISAFFVRQSSGHFDARDNYISDWQPLHVPPILWVNTAILLASSVTVEMSRRQVFYEMDVIEEWLGMGRPATRRALPWLLATLALGSVFVAGQWIAWQQLADQHLTFAATPNSYFFYILTGSHALHLVVGLAALVGAIVGLRYLPRVQLRQIAVDCTAWYWHAMGLLWLLLFGLLVWFQ